MHHLLIVVLQSLFWHIVLHCRCSLANLDLGFSQVSVLESVDGIFLFFWLGPRVHCYTGIHLPHRYWKLSAVASAVEDAFECSKCIYAEYCLCQGGFLGVCRFSIYCPRFLWSHNLQFFSCLLADWICLGFLVSFSWCVLFSDWPWMPMWCHLHILGRFQNRCSQMFIIPMIKVFHW